MYKENIYSAVKSISNIPFYAYKCIFGYFLKLFQYVRCNMYYIYQSHAKINRFEYILQFDPFTRQGLTSSMKHVYFSSKAFFLVGDNNNSIHLV